MSAIEFQLNDQPVRYEGAPERSLLSFLRDDLDLTATKDGCSGEGYCRACTVEMDGRARLACITPMRKVAGTAITTLEGLPVEVRRIIGEAFVRHGAVQCGFCTPGFLARTRILLVENPSPTREEVVESLRHNFCRCTGYHSIVEAVLEASAVLNGTVDPGLSDTTGVGQDQPKYGGLDRALGQGEFVDDLRLDGLLHGALRFSEHARCLIENIDTTAARAMPGVVDVITGEDIPGQRYTGLIAKDWPLMVLPGETTRTIGDVLALVVAETEDQARAAAAAVVVEAEELEPVTDPTEALTSEILIHEGGNLLEESVVCRGGDIDEVLAASAHKVTDTFQTQRIEHAFLEVEACVARPLEDGLEVFSQGQGVYVDRRSIAAILDLPEPAVRVRQVPTGGAFGGKEDLTVQGHAALAAHKLQRPLKVKLSRPESLRMHPKRHPIRLTFTIGCDEHGKLTGMKARIIGDTGAYASVGGKVLERAAGHATGAYHMPCVDLIAQAVYTNNLPCGAMRGFGANQATFALERCLDELCRLGGFDPWQFRYDNALVEGSMTASGQILEGGVGVRATLEAVKPAYDAAGCAGLACGIKNCGVGNGMADWCEVAVTITAADRVDVHHGWTEMGQGVHTVVQQVVAEETGIAPGIIHVTVATEHEAESGMTTSSRGTSLVGNALVVACRDLKRDLKSKALDDLVGQTYRGRWSFDDSTAPGAPGKVVTHYSYSYATQLVVLDDRGAIERVIAAHDAGRIMNPVLFKSQIQGSVHMGLGYSLSEDLPQENGQLKSTKMRRLGLLPMDQTPPVDVIGVEVPDRLGPYGAKGVGEVGLVPTAGAVANAFCRFDGVARTSLPLTPVKESS